MTFGLILLFFMIGLPLDPMLIFIWPIGFFSAEVMVHFFKLWLVNREIKKFVDVTDPRDW